MKRSKLETAAILAFILFLLTGSFTLVVVALTPDKAPAATRWNGVVVNIDSNLPRSWNGNLAAAIRTIDPYTASQIRIHKCVPSFTAHCIYIRRGTVRDLPGQRTMGSTTVAGWITHVTIEPQSPPTYRTLLLVHELGHAFNLTHNPRCNSIMYRNLICNGRMLRPTFTPAEQRILAHY